MQLQLALDGHPDKLCTSVLSNKRVNAIGEIVRQSH